MTRTNILIYTDGAAKGNPGPAGWANVNPITGEGKGGAIKDATNNQAELYAILQAVQSAPLGSRLTVMTDSKLAIGWLSMGWKVRHAHIAVLLSMIFNTQKDRDVEMALEYVEGHSTDKHNKRADAIASTYARYQNGAVTELARR